MNIPAKQLDDKGRCCGRKPLVYKRPHRLWCHRCCAEFSPDTGGQIPNWAFEWISDGVFRSKLTETTG